jgi:hypothetical protein
MLRLAVVAAALVVPAAVPVAQEQPAVLQAGGPRARPRAWAQLVPPAPAQVRAPPGPLADCRKVPFIPAADTILLARGKRQSTEAASDLTNGPVLKSSCPAGF